MDDIDTFIELKYGTFDLKSFEAWCLRLPYAVIRAAYLETFGQSTDTAWLRATNPFGYSSKTDMLVANIIAFNTYEKAARIIKKELVRYHRDDRS